MFCFCYGVLLLVFAIACVYFGCLFADFVYVAIVYLFGLVWLCVCVAYGFILIIWLLI